MFVDSGPLSAAILFVYPPYPESDIRLSGHPNIAGSFNRSKLQPKRVTLLFFVLICIYMCEGSREREPLSTECVLCAPEVNKSNSKLFQ